MVSVVIQHNVASVHSKNYFLMNAKHLRIIYNCNIKGETTCLEKN